MSNRHWPPVPRQGGLTHISKIIPSALGYRAPSYDPPYDSPIEKRLAYHLVKYVSPALNFEPQHHVATPWGHFRLDFAAFRGDRAVGIECDGEAYHSGDDAVRDDWRDAVILGEGAVEAIYRLRGTDIIRHPQDVLQLMSERDPYLFSDRGRRNLDKLASSEPLDRDGWLPGYETAFVSYRLGRDSISHLIIERHNIGVGSNPSPEKRHYQDLYDFACDYGPAPLDEVRGAFLDQANVA